MGKCILKERLNSGEACTKGGYWGDVVVSGLNTMVIPHVSLLPDEKVAQTDLKGIRIHEGKASASVSAIAFAYGGHLHFPLGLFAPFVPAGFKMLVHEITHVIQQRIGRALASPPCTYTLPR